MRLNTIVVVAKREYLQRVQSKGFWIATLILPLFIGSITVLPSLMVAKSNARQTVVVVDETGKVAPELMRLPEKKGEENRAEFVLEPEPSAPAASGIAAQRAALDRRV